MTYLKLRATLAALGIRCSRASGGIAIYLSRGRLWAATPDEAFELALANLDY